MDDLLQKINARLQHYNRDELMALIWDFLTDRDADDLTAFLDLMRQKSRPVVVEALELAGDDALLRSIRELHDAIANDEYVEYGSGYDPAYGEYRGFGDDGWIDEMDSLFAAATGLFRAGSYRAAAAAYLALFDIFGLAEDGYHFTRPDPATALQTDLDVMKQHLFTALGMLNPDPAALVLKGSHHDDDVDGRKRESYAVAGSYAKLIRAIRKIQGRTSDFDRYYRSLFDTYPRLPAFKDELRTAIEGAGHARKR